MNQPHNLSYKKNPAAKIHYRNNLQYRTLIKDCHSILITFHQIIQLQPLSLFTNFMKTQ